MRSIQEYHYRLLYFQKVELLFNREMQGVNFSRTGYKLLFLRDMLLKMRKYKIQPSVFKVHSDILLVLCLRNLLQL